MSIYVWVFLGSGVGGVLRYIVSTWIDPQTASAFPWATFVVNVTGSFLIGLLAGVPASPARPETLEPARTFLLTGVLGGYTTYSAFSLQTLTLARAGQLSLAGVYAGGTLVVCLAAVGLGAACAAVLGSHRG